MLFGSCPLQTLARSHPHTLEPPYLPILYRDDRLVAIAKPYGIHVHRTRLDRQARVFVLQTLRNQIDQHIFPVHRLDRSTSGAMVFGLDSEAATALGAAFQERRVEKSYLAVVRGHPPESGVIDRALRLPDWPKERGESGRMDPDARPMQPAVTAYRTLATSVLPVQVSRYPESWYALVEAQPRTGRWHQIRRHLAGIQHPVLGDRRHGDHRHNHYLRTILGHRRLLLHAARLTIPHPDDGRSVTVHAPPPDAFAQAALALGVPLPAEASRPSGSNPATE
ncbi:MAG: pseudouridine synthase [Bacteroidota bacterium]